MDIIEKKNILKKFPLLSTIDDKDLEALASMVLEQEFNEGDIIIKENDIDTTMYLLIEGVVDVIKTTIYNEEFVCATLKDDMHIIFGEMALIDKDKRSATVIAKTNCKTFSLTSDDFNTFCEEYPKGAVKLLKLMNKNIIRNLRSENENLKLIYQALIEEIEFN